MNTGIDIIEVDRFRGKKDESIKEIFTENEIKYCNKFCDSYVHLSGFFCVKEAFVKALKIGFRKGLKPRDIEVCHDANGSPYIKITEKILSFLEGKSIDINISHTDKTAIAICILY